MLPDADADAGSDAGSSVSGPAPETLHSRKYAGVFYLSKGWKRAWGGAPVDLQLVSEIVPALYLLCAHCLLTMRRRARRLAARGGDGSRLQQPGCV